MNFVVMNQLKCKSASSLLKVTLEMGSHLLFLRSDIVRRQATPGCSFPLFINRICDNRLVTLVSSRRNMEVIIAENEETLTHMHRAAI